jgi:alanine racemase
MRELLIDLDAIAANLNRMRQVAPNSKVCGVIKANAYGHGMIPVAKRLEREGIDYLGVADLAEGLELREAGIATPILAWLHSSSEDFSAAIARNIDLGISTLGQLNRALASGKHLGQVPRIHIKVDTGLGRNGVTIQDLPQLLEAAGAAQDAGDLKVNGIFSHLSCTSREDDLTQIAKFEQALALAEGYGIKPELRHLTASDGTLSYPQAHYDMVRVGIALYGLSPYSDHNSKDYGLTPAMTATAQVVQVKRVAGDEGVSYGYLYRTKSDTSLALVPVGYAEGLPRLATGRISIWLNGQLYPLESRIAMDQFVLDVGDATVAPGDTVVLFGDPAKGYQSADDLGAATDSINYEIVTRMGGRFQRVYLQQGVRLTSAEAGA